MRLSAVLACSFLFAGPAAAQSAPAAEAPAPTRVSAVPPAVDPQNVWLLDLSDGGRVTIQLRPDAAPLMVERVKTLTRQRFYDGLVFHRVIDGFMAQGGDPKGDGSGGSNLPDIKAEFNSLPHVRGAVAAARADKPDSANSQFYIVFQPRFSLDQKYTVFGRVLDGMAYVDAIERGEPPANPTRVLHAYLASDNPPPYQAAPPPPPPAAPATLPGTVSRKPPVVPSKPQGSSTKK
jgi:cyclophilin family peptidyl-prolyl cis-trans isomerase